MIDDLPGRVNVIEDDPIHAIGHAGILPSFYCLPP